MALFATHVVTPDSALGGMVIERSLRMREGQSPELSRTFGTNTSNTTKTFSFWLKRGNVNSSSIQNIVTTTISGYIEGRLRINTDNTLQFEDRDASGGTSDGRRTTSAQIRDASAWYHIMLVLDSTQGTEADRAKIYINGTQATIGADRTISQNYSFSIFRSSVVNYIGNQNGSSEFFDGYLAEMHLIDGQALDPSYFGFTSQNGTWLPKKYTGGNYGTNGFYLDFLDNSSQAALGYDKSGNGNTFAVHNIQVSTTRTNDSFLDTPTNNFPTLNPNSLYHVYSTSSNVAEGNLRYNCNTDNQGQVPATMSMPTSGKWYFEAEVISNANFGMGIVPVTWTVNRNAFSHEPGTLGYAAYGSKFENGSEGAGWGAGWDSGNWAGAAVDMDLKQVTFYANNTSQGTLSFKSGYEDLEYLPIITGGTNGGNVSGYVNFGAQGFKYTPPTGFKALNSRNRAGATGTAAVVNPERLFDIITYTGTDSSAARTIDELKFAPDFIWQKRRNGTNWNTIHDTVRGAGQTLYTNSDSLDTNNNQYGYISAIGTNGFTWSPGSTNNSDGNESSGTFVSWCWKAGGSSNTYNIDGDGYATAAAAGLDGGSINPTGASVNTKAGFGIYTYTGTGSNATIAHGLGKAPEWIIVKNRNATTGSTENWTVYHVENTDNPETDYLSLNSSGSTSDLNTIWNDTAPTSTLISIGSHARVNESASVNYVMYAWTGIDGFSKFSSYVGDGRNDRFSTYIYTGFRPKWVLVKGSDFAGNWNLFDTSRPGYNVTNDRLFPNLSDAETDGSDANNQIDILSNGFKMRGSNVDTNSSGSTYIYMAFAEQPNGTIFGIDSDAR